MIFWMSSNFWLCLPLRKLFSTQIIHSRAKRWHLFYNKKTISVELLCCMILQSMWVTGLYYCSRNPSFFVLMVPLEVWTTNNRMFLFFVLDNKNLEIFGHRKDCQNPIDPLPNPQDLVVHRLLHRHHLGMTHPHPFENRKRNPSMKEKSNKEKKSLVGWLSWNCKTALLAVGWKGSWDQGRKDTERKNWPKFLCNFFLYNILVYSEHPWKLWGKHQT
mmetsp:Transcript_2072/g.2787  ORF Transcript_2072/g.2787 Transcript_2072/m.2787 type:complete len:217 (+) Transcript_2072:2976-3626(+)